LRVRPAAAHDTILGKGGDNDDVSGWGILAEQESARLVQQNALESKQLRLENIVFLVQLVFVNEL